MVKARLHSHAEAAGVDWRHTWHGREYSWMGSTLFTNVAGSPEAIERTPAIQRPLLPAAGPGGGARRPLRRRLRPQSHGFAGLRPLHPRGQGHGGMLVGDHGQHPEPRASRSTISPSSDRTDYQWFNGNMAAMDHAHPWYRSIFASSGGRNELQRGSPRAATTGLLRHGVPELLEPADLLDPQRAAFDDRHTRGGPVVKRTATISATSRCPRTPRPTVYSTSRPGLARDQRRHTSFTFAQAWH